MKAAERIRKMEMYHVEVSWGDGTVGTKRFTETQVLGHLTPTKKATYVFAEIMAHANDVHSIKIEEATERLPKSFDRFLILKSADTDTQNLHRQLAMLKLWLELPDSWKSPFPPCTGGVWDLVESGLALKL